MGHRYDGQFFDYVDESALRSARRVVPIIHDLLAPRSVLDVGCGRAIWLGEWAKLGVADFLGIDGDYVERSRLAIPQQWFVAHDLGTTFALGRTFDLVQCLEVGEHLPDASADTLVDNLSRHGSRIVFSAAVPGQGGEHHVNEQPLRYWAERFRRRGFRVFDALRPAMRFESQVEPWYRYNMLLYVREDACQSLPPGTASTELAPDEPIPDVAPLAWRLRCATLRLLPRPAIDALAVAKHRLAIARAGSPSTRRRG